MPPNSLELYIHAECIDKFCNEKDPGMGLHYNEVFEDFGREVGAFFSVHNECVVFDTEQHKLAFLLKYS